MSADQHRGRRHAARRGGRDRPQGRSGRASEDGQSMTVRARRFAHRVDRAQQDRRWLAIAAGTYKKFSDDQAGNLAALIAYYAFASVFPLLLIAYSILDIIAQQNATVGRHLSSALKGFPLVGSYLGSHVHHGLGKTGIALAIGILLTLYSSRGIANAMQNAMNTVWGVPFFRRPGFGKALLRSLGLIALIGPGEVLTIALSSVAGGTGHLGGVLAKLAALAVSLLLNIGLFWLGFRIATSAQIEARAMRLGAILSAIGWQVLQYFGGLIVSHASNSAYGIFGIVLGILAWFYLQAQLTLYFVELDVVRALRLWPRALVPPPNSAADLRAYELYAQTTAHRPELVITVREQPPAQPGTIA